MSNDAKPHVTRERVPASAEDQSLIIFGTNGGPTKVGTYQMCKNDGIRATESALRGMNMAVDSQEGWWWLPQVHVGEGKKLGEKIPLVCFLVINRVEGLKTYKDYTGQAGVYTCPANCKVNFKNDSKIVWIEGSRRLRSIVTAEDPIAATAHKLCKHFRGDGRMKKLMYYGARGASIAIPIALSSLSA